METNQPTLKGSYLFPSFWLVGFQSNMISNIILRMHLFPSCCQFYWLVGLVETLFETSFLEGFYHFENPSCYLTQSGMEGPSFLRSQSRWRCSQKIPLFFGFFGFLKLQHFRVFIFWQEGKQIMPNLWFCWTSSYLVTEDGEKIMPRSGPRLGTSEAKKPRRRVLSWRDFQGGLQDIYEYGVMIWYMIEMIWIIRILQIIWFISMNNMNTNTITV